MGRFNPIKEMLYAPQAVIAANTPIDLGETWDMMEKLVQVVKFDLATATITTLTIVDTTPAAGQIQLTDNKEIELGDATTAAEIYIIRYLPLGEVTKLVG